MGDGEREIGSLHYCKFEPSGEAMQCVFRVISSTKNLKIGRPGVAVVPVAGVSAGSYRGDAEASQKRRMVWYARGKGLLRAARRGREDTQLADENGHFSMGTKLYVGNLSYATNEETLRAVFAESGRQVRNVSVIIDRETGRSRGFGFVQMATPEEAQAAMAALDGYEVEGRPLRVKEAREREPGGREPAGREPGGREPGGREPGGREPGGREPGGREPGGREPGGREPGGREPAGREGAREGAREAVREGGPRRIDNRPGPPPPRGNPRERPAPREQDPERARPPEPRDVRAGGGGNGPPRPGFGGIEGSFEDREKAARGRSRGNQKRRPGAGERDRGDDDSDRGRGRGRGRDRDWRRDWDL